MFKAWVGHIILLKLLSEKLGKLVRFKDLKTKVYYEKCLTLNPTK